MLDSTFELISLAASNSLAAFCFCNLIIAFLLVSKPSLQLIPDKPKAAFDYENSNKITVSSPCEKVNTEAEEVEEEKVSSASITMVHNVDTSPYDEDDDHDHDHDHDEVEEEEEKVLSASIIMVGNVDASPNDEDEDEDDDELRRRFEEFIEKINKGWRAEKMKTYSLGQL